MQMLIKIYPQNIGIMKTTSLMIGVYINKYIYKETLMTMKL